MTRLAEVLTEAPNTAPKQVENFLGSRRMVWGTYKRIEVGNVVRNYQCARCRDMRSYSSSGNLSCLVTGESTISIDVSVRCPGCDSSAEIWFLVAAEDDLYGPSPTVFLERFSENRRDTIAALVSPNEKIDDLFDRAKIAFDNGLGAGAMVYLRKIFEITTIHTAESIGISICRTSGSRKPFKDLLREVDEAKQIVPQEYSKNGYRLFGELSDEIHGDSDETTALSKYDPCRKLVYGIVDNVRKKHGFEEAMTGLGWPGSLPMNDCSESDL